MRQIEAIRPRTPDQLHRFVRMFVGLRVPRKPIVAGSAAPFVYLVHTFFEDGAAVAKRQAGLADGEAARGRDVLVWANRGGGKTMLGAVATLVDLLFKPGIQVRILGGSLEQSSKMYGYLRQMFRSPVLRQVLAREPTQRRIELVNGSAAEVLAQSHRSVRGTRVHKLRCDEVEEFRPDVWEAAQRVTRSGRCGSVYVRGAIEALSTMHRPFGLMDRLVDRVGSVGSARLIKWSALDVIERCPPARDCGKCVLWDDCQGRAKHAHGFMPVDDLVDQWHRSSDEAWASEMMCKQPRRSESVYPGFEVDKHVVGDRAGAGSPRLGSSTAVAAKPQAAGGEGDLMIAGMDFGMRSPLVMLLARVRGGGDVEQCVVEVLDEHVEESQTLEQHLVRIEQRCWPVPVWIGVDPAGGQRNSQTGLTDIQVLRRHGYTVRAHRRGIRDGVERIRRRLDRGTLLIDRRCVRLIEALSKYHFDVDRPANPWPVKDGPDHACDALRYMIVSLEIGSAAVKVRRY
ncbi:MAG: hypothetical protein V3U29_04015 [Phycisphaeraceae bacterium]